MLQTLVTPRRITKGQFFSFLIGLMLSVLILVWLFRTISFSQVLALLKGADIRALLIFAVISVTTTCCYALRFRLLLAVSGEFVPFGYLFGTSLVRSLCAELLPARLGTLSYVAILTTRLGVRTESAFSSWIAAYCFDLFAMAPLVVTLLMIVGGEDSISIHLLILASSILFALSTAALYFFPLFLTFVISKCQNRKPTLVARLVHVRDDLLKIKQPRCFLQVAFLSVIIRLLKYTALYVLLLALLMPQGYSMQALPVVRVVLGMIAAEASAMLSFSGIAGIGIYQGTWSLVFSLLGFSEQSAALTAISHHLLTQVWGYLLGLVALAILMAKTRTRALI